MKNLKKNNNSKLNRRQFIKALTAGAASLTIPACSNPNKIKSDTAEKPNIILIMADDMGYSDLGCYGSEIHTPNLDRLAYNGLRFTQFYNTARCCPTRASLLTGLYPHQAGMGKMVSHKPGDKPPGPYQGYLNNNCVTLAEVLKSADYTTLMSGKWHVGELPPHWPTDRGFDKYYGLISGGANYFDITKSKHNNRIRHFAIDDKPHMPPKENFYITDAFTENAVKFLDQNAQGQNPFFLYLAYTAPHWPLHALPEDIAKYRGKYTKGWENLRQKRYKQMLDMGLIDKKYPLSPLNPDTMPWDDVPDKDLMDLKMAVYAAQIDRMDQGIGKVLDKLKQIGKDDNTLILFLSDNGACAEIGPLGYDWWKNGVPPGGVNSYQSYGLSWANASNTPLKMFKKYTHEGGIATPLIAYWPKVIKQKGKITRQPGHIIDIMATLCDISGAKYPDTYKQNKIKPMEGKPLTPIFEGKKRTPHKYLFFEHIGNRAVRKGKYKLVAGKNKPWQLYDLDADRTEINNIIDKHPNIANKLINAYNQWAKNTGVK